jgi:hypothetical protein
MAGWSSGLHDGPAHFPHPSSLARALEEIGYPKAGAASPVGQPTPDDYWEFLSNLSWRGSARDRAELVRRVMGLQ